MGAVLDLILDLLYPPKCMLCQRIMDSGETVLCPGCAVSDLPEYEGKDPQIQYFEAAAVTFFYEEPMIGAILRFKFHGMRSYTDQFTDWLAATIRNKLAGQYDILSWVPCSKRRAWTRGFDQSELLARALAEKLDADCIRTLTKVKHNRKQSQTGNAAKRRANVLGVYRPYHRERFAGKRILLIDDVVTTGATLSECGKTLRMAGAGPLVCAALAAAHREKK